MTGPGRASDGRSDLRERQLELETNDRRRETRARSALQTVLPVPRKQGQGRATSIGTTRAPSEARRARHYCEAGGLDGSHDDES